MNYGNISELLGKTLTKIVGMENGDNEIIFHSDDGKRWRMFHQQDCCETVYLDDVSGDVEDLLNSEILVAEETEGATRELGEYIESYTWTFYRLATKKGYVVLRWLGRSNGYYSERVHFAEL